MLTLSMESIPDLKAAQDEQIKMEYKAKLDKAMKCKRTYEQNLVKAYALLWERCAKAMQNCINARKEYESKIYSDPMELLRAIKEHLLNYLETRYEMSIILDAFQALIHARQKEQENLQDYTQCFKTATKILVSHIGSPIMLKKFVDARNGYDATNQDKTDLQFTEASKQFFTYLYLENVDQEKYGSLMQNLSSQRSLGNDQYPKTLAEANNVVSNH